MTISRCAEDDGGKIRTSLSIDNAASGFAWKEPLLNPWYMVKEILSFNPSEKAQRHAREEYTQCFYPRSPFPLLPNINPPPGFACTAANDSSQQCRRDRGKEGRCGYTVYNLSILSTLGKMLSCSLQDYTMPRLTSSTVRRYDLKSN